MGNLRNMSKLVVEDSVQVAVLTTTNQGWRMTMHFQLSLSHPIPAHTCFSYFASVELYRENMGMLIPLIQIEDHEGWSS